MKSVKHLKASRKAYLIKMLPKSNRSFCSIYHDKSILIYHAKLECFFAQIMVTLFQIIRPI